jgi:aryl-alcohol dehydrogenase-like predicted oxidoreductase
MMVPKRTIGPLHVQAIGLGCMSLSHAYGTAPDPRDAAALLRRAIDIGYDFIDTAALYGFGANEGLIGEALADRRGQFAIASKCGMTGVDGQRVIDGRPETLRRTLEESLRRLRTDVIDLYYLHRWDKRLPIEESIGAMADFVREGKVRALGLSEVSAATLRKAETVHPIAAVQNEYSPWSRNVELGVLEATREKSGALVAFSPTGRGFLTGAISAPDELMDTDLRKSMPRFQGKNFERNRILYRRFEQIARDVGCTPAQLSLAWVVSRGEHVVAIPGTTSLKHLEDNFAALTLALPNDAAAAIDALFAPDQVAGDRYSAVTLAEIDTEQL